MSYNIVSKMVWLPIDLAHQIKDNHYVLLYSETQDKDTTFAGIPYTASNPMWAREAAGECGYTHFAIVAEDFPEEVAKK